MTSKKVEIKIIDAKKNKNLKDDVLKTEINFFKKKKPQPPIPPDGGEIIDTPPKPPQITAADVLNRLTEFVIEQRHANQGINSRLDQMQTDINDLKHRMGNVETTLKEHGNKIDNIDKRVINLENRN